MYMKPENEHCLVPVPAEVSGGGCRGLRRLTVVSYGPDGCIEENYELIYTDKIMNYVPTVYTASQIPSQGTE